MQDFTYSINKKELHCCGIYKINNKINNKNYVGSSKEIYGRIHKHKCLLLKNEHPNAHLQCSFNKYGHQSFEVSILEKCDESLLSNREQHWVDALECMSPDKGYNQAEVSKLRGNVFNQQSRSKTSKSLMRGKNLVMYSKDNEKLFVFNSLFDAAEYIIENKYSNGSARNVRIKISEAARGKTVSTGYGQVATRSTAYGYKWGII